MEHHKTIILLKKNYLAVLKTPFKNILINFYCIKKLLRYLGVFFNHKEKFLE